MSVGMSELLQTVAPVRWDRLGDGPVTAPPDALEERAIRSAKRLRNRSGQQTAAAAVTPGRSKQHKAAAPPVMERLTPVPSSLTADTSIPAAPTMTAAAADKPADFDPSAEYARLLQTVSRTQQDRRGESGDSHEDPYQALMRRERRVLDTVDRMVNEKRSRESYASSLGGMPINLHAARFVGVLRGLLDDLTAARSVHDVVRAVSRQDRQLYLGVGIILLAVVSMLILHV